MTQQGYTGTDTSSSRELKIVGSPDTDELREVVPVTAAVHVSVAPEGHILLVLPAGTVVSGSMASEAAEKVEKLAGTGKLPMLLVLTGVEALTRSARTVFGSAASLEAVAVLGVSPVDRVIANFLLGGNTQPCPTRYFSTEPEALEWLQRKCPVA